MKSRGYLQIDESSALQNISSVNHYVQLRDLDSERKPQEKVKSACLKCHYYTKDLWN